MKLTACFILILLGVTSLSVRAQKSAAVPDLAQLEKMASRFAPTPLRVDTSRLSPGDRQALVKLIEAARILNDVFMQQMWEGNVALYGRLQRDTTPLGKARLHYFWINKGPWSDVDDYKAFFPGVPPRKPLGANFYPESMTKEAFESWVAQLPPKEQEQAKSFFTVIRWRENSKPPNSLLAVPYSQEYADGLTKAANLLREAAGLTDNASLKKFLNLRADAFLSNDYYESDMAWMDLDAPLDITIGPYETYNDELFGYKAAFEAYVNLRDDDETAKLSVFTRHLQDIENNLPIDPQYRNPKLGAAAPIRVVDEILSAGDGAHGVQTAAYNLPNDDRVVQQKGSKRVMLKNVQEAKFRSVLLPIARRTLSQSAMVDVSFEPFFTHILAHELMHGLGPHQIKVQGRDTTPREELKELYSAIEEPKADVTGLFALQYMMDHAKEMGLGNAVGLGNLRVSHEGFHQRFEMGIAKGSDESRQGLPQLADILGGLGQVIGEVDLGVAQAAQLVNRDLEAVLVFVEQAFDLEEVVLLEGVDRVLDVIPHLGFDLAGAITQDQRQIRLSGLLRLDLLGNDHKTRGDDLVFVVRAIGQEEFLHAVQAKLNLKQA